MIFPINSSFTGTVFKISIIYLLKQNITDTTFSALFESLAFTGDGETWLMLSNISLDLLLTFRFLETEPRFTARKNISKEKK